MESLFGILGPFQWPVIGNGIDMIRANPKFPHLAHHELSKKYGDLMSLKLGVHDFGITVYSILSKYYAYIIV